MYRIFKRGDEAPSVRSVVIALVVCAVAATGVGVVRVAHQHDVLRLGFEISRKAEHVRELHEQRRQLELEYATLTAPERIRKLATQLGMTPVAPDRIRVVHVRAQVTVR